MSTEPKLEARHYHSFKKGGANYTDFECGKCSGRWAKQDFNRNAVYKITCPECGHREIPYIV